MRGLRSGLIMSLSGLLGILLGLLVAYKHHKALADYLIVCWKLDEKILPIIKPLLSFSTPAKSKSLSAVPLDQATNYSDVFSPLLKIIQGIGLSGEHTIGEMLSLALAQGVVNILAFIMLLIITDMLVKTVGYILNGFFDWGIIKPFNRMGGVLFGVARGMLIIFIVIAVLLPLQMPAVLLGADTFLTRGIENSKLAYIFWQYISFSQFSPAGSWFVPESIEQLFLKTI